MLIISTRRDTKKFDILTENENVALLVHDFATHADSPNDDYTEINSRPRYSITLNGEVREEEGELAEAYRAFHLQRNAEYSQFIVGDDIAVISVKLTSARVCDVNDIVRHFSRSADSPQWEEVTQPSSPSTRAT